MAATANRSHHPGAVLFNLTVGLAALGGLAWAGARALAPFSPSANSRGALTSAVRRSPDPLTNQELGVALTRLGLAAEQLAASGCSAQETTALVSRAREHLQTAIQDVRDADQAWADARRERDRLQRLVIGGQREQAAALQAAQTTLTNAENQRASVLAAVFQATVEGLDPSKLAQVSTLRANGAWDLPTQYLAANRSEPDWVHLRDALANDRISVARGEAPDPGEQQFLLTVNANPAVAAATSNLAGLAELRAAWNAAVYP